MGRTQTTYRMRLQQIRDRLTSLSTYNKQKYHQLWQICHQLSAPSSTLPYPDTHAIATFAMILEMGARLSQIEEDMECRD